MPAQEAFEDDDEAFLRDDNDPGYQDLNRLELILNDQGGSREEFEMQRIHKINGRSGRMFPIY